MFVALRDSLSDIASFDDREDGDDEDDKEIEQRQLSQDDEPDWVMGTITKLVQRRMQGFRQKQRKRDELTQPGREYAADYIHEEEKKYGTSEVSVPAVIQPKTDNDAVAPAPPTFGDLMECVDIVPGISQMPLATSRPGSSHMRLGTGKPQSNTSRYGLAPATEPDSSLIQNAKPVELVTLYPCIEPLQQITISISDSNEDMVTAPVSLEE